MTATTAAPRVTLPGVIRSEWIKLRSIRTNVLSLLAGPVIMVAMAVAYSFVFTRPELPEEAEGAFDPLSLSLAGVSLAQLAFVTVGVLSVTTEYSTGSIRATLSAVPRRLPVLWSKLVVVTAATFAAAAVGVVTAFLVGQAILRGAGLDYVSPGQPGVLKALIGTAGYLAGTAFMGVCVGFLLRSTALAATTLFGVLLILDSVLSLLPDAIYSAIAPYLPSNSAASFTSLVIPDGALPYWGGLGVYLAYLAALAVGGAIVLRNRDA